MDKKGNNCTGMRGIPFEWAMGIAMTTANKVRSVHHGCMAPATTWVAAVLIAVSAGSALANGLGESRPWQFDTSADKANKAAELDLMERKKGGYYDGFSTVYNSTTNIGTQINCSNDASATGNIAQNGQTGNAPSASSDASTSSDATGSSSTQDTGSGSGSSSSDQTNSGGIDSSVLNSPSESNSSVSDLGGSDQDLTNNQDNSGNQTAGVDSSTACDMSGANLTGDVSFHDQSVASGALN